MRNVDPSKTYVYQLRAENSALPFYIGKGKAYRMYQHEGIADSGHKSPKYEMIRQLKAQQIQVHVEVLFESTDNELCRQKEREFIAQFGRKRDGGCLLNITKGGEGKPGYTMPAEAVSNSVSKRKGQKRTEETLKRMREAQQGRVITEEHREAIRQAYQSMSPEQKKTMGRNQSQNSGCAKSPREERAMHLLQLELSGKTRYRYCLDNGISESTFREWEKSSYVREALEQLRNTYQPKADLPHQELLNVDKSLIRANQLTLPF